MNTMSLKPPNSPSGKPLPQDASFLLRQWSNERPLPGNFQSLLADPRFCRKLEGAARGSPGRRGYYSLDAEMVELLLKEGKL